MLNDTTGLPVKHIAPNALQNSSARYDAPKCDEDTRIEVTREIMEDRDGPFRLPLRTTGSAGSRKSALQQTICERKGTLASALFLSASDPSRNTVDPVVACQLGERDPAAKELIEAAVEKSPLIFSKSQQNS
jgi:hypothetical protein